MKSDAEAEAMRAARPGRRRGRPHPQRGRTGQDPQFYAFLKKLEDYQRILGDNKTLLLLSTHRELFDLLFNPPTAAPRAEAGAPRPGHACAAKPRSGKAHDAMRIVLDLSLVLAAGCLPADRRGAGAARRAGRGARASAGCWTSKPEPGLWIGLPWGMDRVDRVAVDRVQQRHGRLPAEDDDGDTTCRPASS